MSNAPQPEFSCLVAFQIGNRSLSALDIRVKDNDVYVNHFRPDGTQEMHTSYHASGQRHTKRGRDYAFQFIGPSGRPQPVKHIRPRPELVEDRENVTSTGWLVSALCELLLPADRLPDMLVDTTMLDPSSNLAVLVNIVGPRASPLHEIAGFPILKSHCVFSAVTVEIIAFSVAAFATT
jgi:hypothetical protein